MFNLVCLYDGRGYGWEILYLRYVVSLWVLIIFSEFLVEMMDIFFDRFNEMCLIFLNGVMNFGLYKKSVEFGENFKYFLGIFCCCKFVF